MFEGDMNLHNFASMALPEHVTDVVDSTLLNVDEDLVDTGNQRHMQERTNIKIECLISKIKIGVACSMDSPQDRMNINNIVHELKSIKNILLRSRTMFNMQRDNKLI